MRLLDGKESPPGYKWVVMCTCMLECLSAGQFLIFDPLPGNAEGLFLAGPAALPISIYELCDGSIVDGRMESVMNNGIVNRIFDNDR